MKSSLYTKNVGIGDKTAFHWWKVGTLDASQIPTGTVVVRDSQEERQPSGRIAWYARVSSIDQKNDLDQHMQRLKDDATARGYTVAKEVTKIGSGLNDLRPKFLKLLADNSSGTLLVEHKDGGTHFGWNSMVTFHQVQGRHIEALFPTCTRDDLVNDGVGVITSLAARISGGSKSKRRAAKMNHYGQRVMK
jgi:putative resolvase